MSFAKEDELRDKIKDIEKLISKLEEDKKEPMAKEKKVTVAGIVKKELSAIYPNIKFSCGYSSFAGGDSVSVAWDFGVTKDEVGAIATKYECGTFDGMTDLYNYKKKEDRAEKCAKYVNTYRRYDFGLNKMYDIVSFVAKDFAKLNHVKWEGENTRSGNLSFIEIARKLLSLNSFHTDTVTSYEGIVPLLPNSPYIEDEMYEILYNKGSRSINMKNVNMVRNAVKEGQRVVDKEGNERVVRGFTYDKTTNVLNGVILKGQGGEKVVDVLSFDNYFTKINEAPKPVETPAYKWNKFGTDESRIKWVKQKGHIVTFKEKHPNGVSIQVGSEGIEHSVENVGNIRIKGKFKSSAWYPNMKALLDAIDWEDTNRMYDEADERRFRALNDLPMEDVEEVIETAEDVAEVIATTPDAEEAVGVIEAIVEQSMSEYINDLKSVLLAFNESDVVYAEISELITDLELLNEEAEEVQVGGVVEPKEEDEHDAEKAKEDKVKEVIEEPILTGGHYKTAVIDKALQLIESLKPLKINTFTSTYGITLIGADGDDGKPKFQTFFSFDFIPSEDALDLERTLFKNSYKKELTTGKLEEPTEESKIKDFVKRTNSEGRVFFTGIAPQTAAIPDANEPK